ncbi:Alpha/Beta hydrolase protein [Collybia nuda]|uniref:Alpha/Beta hydrolase protein n=1 Tax=Collybia nuda TaxID=64659 RepID=A0A9P5YEW0_9AGAR|nr:Alpha/Beta hydrolase protein [Collybia nuda]
MATQYTPESKVLISADGTEIYADAIGDRAKPALVFIHGFSLSSVVFDSIFADHEWTNHVYLVRYDVRGHGKSGKPIDEASWESKRLAGDFDAVVEGFKLIKPIPVGWSMGGTHITDVLSLHPPSYLTGVVYISPLPYMGPILQQVASPAVLACLPRFLRTDDVNIFQGTALEFLDLCSQTCPQSLRLACLGSIMVQPRAVTQRVLSRTQDQTGLFKAGEESGLPFLLFDARADAIIDGKAVRSAVAGWRNLKVVEIDGADHMPWVGHPQVVRQGILDWVKGITALRQP